MYDYINYNAFQVNVQLKMAIRKKNCRWDLFSNWHQWDYFESEWKLSLKSPAIFPRNLTNVCVIRVSEEICQTELRFGKSAIKNLYYWGSQYELNNHFPQFNQILLDKKSHPFISLTEKPKTVFTQAPTSSHHFIQLTKWEKSNSWDMIVICDVTLPIGLNWIQPWISKPNHLCPCHREQGFVWQRP